MSDKEEMDNQILKLKLEKTKVKTAFTKTKNKLLQCVDTEDPNKEEIRSWQDKLDQVVDHATDIMERLSLVYQEGKDNENANKVCEEIEKMDKEFNEATQTVNDITIKMKTNTNSVEADTSPVQTGLEKDLWRQMKRVGIPLFYGDKRRYDSWRAAFDACIDKAPATREYKLLQLRQYVKGEALACIEDLGHSAVAYEAAKERLERKFGGERRKMMRFIDDLERFVPMKNEDPKQVERFADLLDIAVINMKEAEREEDLGAGSLYLSLQKKMPEGMISRFHRWIHENEETESVETLREWVNQEAKYITIASEAKHGLSSIEKSKPQKSNNRSASYFVSQKTKQISDVKECKMCRGNHNIWECEGFKSLDIPNRWTKAKEMGLCYRCLRDNHMGNECRNFKKCGINDCKKNHNRLLHQDFSTSSTLNMHAQEYVPNNRPEPHQAFYNSKSEIALRTVPVILTANGKKICVNALLDDGSTNSYINQELAAELGLQGKIEHVRVNVLNDKVESFETMSVNLGLESLNGQINMNIETFVLDNVTGSLQTVNWNDHSSKWEHLKGIKFPVMTRKSKVDILIGLDYANLHSSLHEIHGKPGDPVARLTPLGWTCVGRIDERTQTSLFCTYFVQENDDLMQVVKGFWEVDSFGTQEKCIEMSPSEKVVLRNAEEGIEYKDGRYEVKIPWKDERHLPENFQMAQKRLENTEKKIKKDPEVETLYRSTIESYIEKGYISKVTEEAKSSASKWYLPHFPVVRPEKQTTKVRIVFDAAAKCEGVSLNDCIHQGPKLQNELLNVLLRFRKKEIAVVCDISEMYLQIGINEIDRRYHWMLWNGDVYEFNRLVFGVNASPFLAHLVSQVNAKNHADTYPMAADTVLKSTYMDDSMDSVYSDDEGIELYYQLSNLWKKAGMYARKWLSNSVKVLEQVPEEDRASEVDLDTGYLPTTKALGVVWKANSDTFTFKLQKEKTITPSLTKRNLLKSVASVFDALGFLSPYLIQGKIFIQKLWLSNYDWDDIIESDVAIEIEQWLHGLSKLNNVSIPRSLSFETTKDTVLHVFVDASEEAYAAVLYVRHVDNEIVTTKFVCSKTRVAPLSSISIPRLELMGAVLGLRIAMKVAEALEISKRDILFWTDSANVLHWIAGQSRHYKPFVSHRIGEIHENSLPVQWRHIPGKNNPADIASRGVSAENLVESELWWNGPEFLQSCLEEWPENLIKLDKCDDSEIKRNAKVMDTYVIIDDGTNEDRLDPERFSDWFRLLRVTAWVKRFINNCRTKTDKNKSKELTVEEVNEAELTCLHQAQKESYRDEYDCLRKGQKLPSNSKLLPLNVKLDENGIIRCDTRLKYANVLSYNARFPIVLPRKNHVTKLIVKHYHEQGGHYGTNQTLASLSSRYWIVSAREEIREWEKQCCVCKKQKAHAGSQFMAPLPTERLNMSMRAFTNCSVDFAGPFMTMQGRGKARQKRYLCLFTCMETRAVHLEIAYSLDTDSFLNAFYRMASRRGFPSQMFSDNGTNFVGACRELKELVELFDKDKMAKSGTKNGVNWHFNPPYAPHFGGIHESMIKSAKRAVYKVLNGADITDEELLTAFVGAEGLINSRPLCYQTANPSDDCVLTPNHFLHGQLGGQFAPETVDTTSFDMRKRWRRVQEIVKHFWHRWLCEFLPMLSGRKKWLREQRDFDVGDIVLVIDQDKPRGHWSLGIITEVFPGRDKHVRVVNVRIGQTIIKRSVTRLCLIEKHEDYA